MHKLVFLICKYILYLTVLGEIIRETGSLKRVITYEKITCEPVVVKHMGIFMITVIV